jgi:uncharacterized protein (TIGR04222 family)
LPPRYQKLLPVPIPLHFSTDFDQAKQVPASPQRGRPMMAGYNSVVGERSAAARSSGLIWPVTGEFNMSLMDNPIGNLRGPEFLLLYGVVIVATLFWAAWACRRWVAAIGAPPPVPRDPDPLEIAYLRAGAGEAVRTAVVELVDRGYLEYTPGVFKNTVRQARPLSDAYVGAIQRAVHAYFVPPGKTVQAAFQDAIFRQSIGELCAPWRKAHESAGLVHTSEDRRTAARVAFAAVAIIGLLGLFKLWVALERSKHNVLFLVVFCAVGCVAALILTRPGRLTKLGKQYMSQLRLAFADLRGKTSPNGRGLRTDGPTADQPTNPAEETYAPGLGTGLALGMGIFGAAALTDSAYARLSKDMRGATHGGGCSGGGCGWSASCGSSGDSGCGSGSSCGGGGGCGGCGGGD